MKKNVVVAVLMAVTSAVSSQGGDSVPALPDSERPYVEALLASEAKHPEGRRPILVLDVTDPRVPEGRSEKSTPGAADLESKVFQTNGLSVANDRPYSLAHVQLPRGVILYSAAKYERAATTDHGMEELFREFGGVEPLVLSVSRPFEQYPGRAAQVLLHVDATWSGCGGINAFRVRKTSKGWAVELADVLLFW